jgi:hypothetical protein
MIIKFITTCVKGTKEQRRNGDIVITLPDTKLGLGLKDMNGIEIFSGDKLNYVNKAGYHGKGVVEYNPDSCGFQIKTEGKDRDGSMKFFTQYFSNLSDISILK